MEGARKTGRLDPRIAEEQLRQIDAAADVNGMGASQRSSSRLMESARRDIAEQGLIEQLREPL